MSCAIVYKTTELPILNLWRLPRVGVGSVLICMGRRGALVRIHHVHPVYLLEKLHGLGACLRTTIEVTLLLQAVVAAMALCIRYCARVYRYPCVCNILFID